MKIGETVTKAGLTLKVLEEIAPGLFFVRCHGGMARLHDGTIYRGYADKNGRLWRVHTWAREKGGARFERNTYRTQAGAERQLKAHGLRLNAEG